LKGDLMEKDKSCPVCGGRRRCWTCGGTGKNGSKKCLICDGTGNCPRCKGKGKRSSFGFSFVPERESA